MIKKSCFRIVIILYVFLNGQHPTAVHACLQMGRPLASQWVTHIGLGAMTFSSPLFYQIREQHSNSCQYLGITPTGRLQVNMGETPLFFGVQNLNLLPKKIWPLELWNPGCVNDPAQGLRVAAATQAFLPPEPEQFGNESPNHLARFVFPKIDSYKAHNIFSVIYGGGYPIAQRFFLTSASNIVKHSAPAKRAFVSNYAQNIRLYGYNIINLSFTEIIPYAQVMVYCFIHPLWHHHKDSKFNIAVVGLCKNCDLSDQELHDLLAFRVEGSEEYDIQFVNKEIGFLGKQEFEEIRCGEQILDAHKIIYCTKKLDHVHHSFAPQPVTSHSPQVGAQDNHDCLKLRADLVPFVEESMMMFHKMIKYEKNPSLVCTIFRR